MFEYLGDTTKGDFNLPALKVELINFLTFFYISFKKNNYKAREKNIKTTSFTQRSGKHSHSAKAKLISGVPTGNYIGANSE